MSNNLGQVIFFALIAVASLVAVAAIIATSIYRSRMAPRVREAMNTAYNKVEAVRINHDDYRTDGNTLHWLDLAFAKYRDARRALSDGRFKDCVKLAGEATRLIDKHESRIVYRTPMRPVPPSMRVISHPDNLVWMG